jgi:hypothetical protein
LTIAAFVASLGLTSAARANIGEIGGDVVSEPGGVKGISITRETLTIDLRPLAEAQPARVHVTYHLFNPGAPLKPNLLFISGSATVGDFEVLLGEKRVDVQPRARKAREERRGEIPKEWRPPGMLPGISGEKIYFNIEPYDMVPIEFSVEFPSGASILQVRYRAKAAGSPERYPTTTWMLPYVLAPARQWGGFGGLDVLVHLPEGWQFHCNPVLKQEGNELHGSFTELPADFLTLAVRAPLAPDTRRAFVRFLGLYAAAVFGGAIACWWSGRSLGRWLGFRCSARLRASSLPINIQLLFAVVVGAGWLALIYASLFWGWRGVHESLGGQASPVYYSNPYWSSCVDLIVIALSFPIGTVITYAGGSRAFKRATGLGKQLP